MKKNKMDRNLTGITPKVIRDYIDTGKNIERAADAVVEALLDHDREEVIFQTISRENGLSEVKLMDVRIEQEYIPVKGEKVPKRVEVPRVLARVRPLVGSSEAVWFDANLLSFHGETLQEEVKKYIERLTTPVLARRKAAEIRHMKDLMERYPKEAAQAMKG
jgi:hypothetical protein